MLPVRRSRKDKVVSCFLQETDQNKNKIRIRMKFQEWNYKRSWVQKFPIYSLALLLFLEKKENKEKAGKITRVRQGCFCVIYQNGTPTWHKNRIISILKNKDSPLSYKIIKKNDRYYICCTFEIQIEKENFVTCSNYGTIGLDFNKGFITLSETNQYGHLVRTQFLPYHFKSGNKTKTDLQKIANHVTTLACRTGKDICIENLDFKTTKSKTETNYGKQYNDMIHSLAYRQFIDIIESAAYRNKVTLTKVNPAWTSWLAKKLYCPTMKLNVHIGASYVIARRGQGYKDTVKSL